MARKAIVVKNLKLKKKKENAMIQGKKLQFSTKVYNRCGICSRSRGYLRKYDMCRICFRELASKGEIAGVKKSSW
jgi:small subunit ribosomal protein S14